MLRFAVVVLVLAGCEKGASKPKAKEPATLSTGTVAPDGVRSIKIEAGKDGYVPERIPGKPGEKLNLVFTRTVEGECLRELKTPDGKIVELPMNKPYEIAVTVPQSGEVKFACGMDMFFGVIVAEQPKS
ncbi:MAG TPA: cupredoxin domain-containing protein [Kofleriaceae bacterium]